MARRGRDSLERHDLDEPPDVLVPKLDHLLELCELLVTVDDAVLDDDEFVRGPVNLENAVGVNRGLIRREDVVSAEERRVSLVSFSLLFHHDPMKLERGAHVFVSYITNLVKGSGSFSFPLRPTETTPVVELKATEPFPTPPFSAILDGVPSQNELSTESFFSCVNPLVAVLEDVFEAREAGDG